VTVAKVCDGIEINKLTFRSNFSKYLMHKLYELEDIVMGVRFERAEDALVWQYESRGVYSSQSLYPVINFRGVKHVYVPAIWKVCTPPRVQVFIWLMSCNKLMTTDNLLQRNIVKTLKCHSYDENESVHRLFFGCVVARSYWGYVKYFTSSIINNYIDMARKWLCETKHELLNNIPAGVCWVVWLTRNDMIFHGPV
jgi:hypothetical protein